MLHPCAPLLPEEVILRVKKLSVPLLLDGVKGKTGGLAGPHDKVAEVGAAVIALAVDDHNIAIRLEGVAGQVDGKVVPLPGLHRQA